MAATSEALPTICMPAPRSSSSARALLLAFLCGLCTSAAAASHRECAAQELLSLIDSGTDVYLGEYHGTAETPKLVACLIERAIARNAGVPILSLELPEEARDARGFFWEGQDGRSSMAMWNLLQSALAEEAQGKLRLHFQIGTKELHAPTQQDSERSMGSAMNELATQGQLIAYGGNFHSRKSADGLPIDLKPAGSFLAKDVVHISIEPGKSGNAWFCFGNQGCGIHELEAATSAAKKIDHLVADKEGGHDFIYFLGGMTASPPKTAVKKP